jgi:ATP-binding cassette subfamily B protein
VKRYEQIISRAYDAVGTMLIPSTVNDPVNPKTLPKTTAYTLSLSDVDYRYDESTVSRYALKNFSLDIQPGEKIGIVGYSGSGKTTLTKLMLRFMDVTRGTIMLDGIDIRDLKQHDLRLAVSYVPQEPLLFHRSVSDNIAYGKPSATMAEIKQAAKLAYVEEFAQDLPDGYQTFVGERGVKLSGGQRQRVAIARALLKNAPILVLDEATSALDSESEKYIQQALWELMKGRTAIVIAHRLSTIQRLDRIVVMDKGKIVQLGSHNDLLADTRGIYAKLWAHQSGGYLPKDVTGK